MTISRQWTQAEAAMHALEQAMEGLGDDAQLANVDLQSALHHQQLTLQLLSRLSKHAVDVATAVIRKIG